MINAPGLHEFLGVGKDFSIWIKARIELFGFLENKEFRVFAEIGELTSVAADQFL